MKQNDSQDDEEQLKIHDVRGECFAPHLALMLKSEWPKFLQTLISSEGDVRELMPAKPA